MATMIDNKSTEYYGEQKVWEYFHKLLSDDVIVYNTREVLGKEYDFCLLLKNKGIIIVEVKGWKANGMRVENPDKIYLSGNNEPLGSPKKQARTYKFCMMKKIQNDLGFVPLIMDMVCYPFIEKDTYYNVGLNIVSEEACTILADDFESSNALSNKLERCYSLFKSIPHIYFTEDKMMRVRQKMEPTFVIRCDSDTNLLPYSKLTILLNKLEDKQIGKIINEYSLGVKQIVFVRDRKDYELIIKRLDDLQKKKNITILSNKIVLGYNNKTISYNNSNEFSVFNFQLYYSDSILNICSSNIEIIEGNKSEEQNEILKKLSLITGFNYSQYLIEHSNPNENILVEAGAGTGKTFSMVSRVAFLCNNMQNSLDDISKELVMITFTNVAADNMKTRLKQMFVNYFMLTNNNRYLRFIEDLSNSNISTIHKFVIELLRTSPVYTGLGINFKISNNIFLRRQIYDKYLSEYIEDNKASSTFKEIPINVYELRQMLMDFSDVILQKSIDISDVDDFGTPQNNIIPHMNELIEDVIIPAEEEYKQAMAFDNKIDLSTVIVMIEHILNNYDEDLTGLKYRYIFIDEFQDTDDVQIELFQKIQKKIGIDCNFFVVGDLKQSIYRFRGATMSAFKTMKQNSLNKWNTYYINKNYRTNNELLCDYDKVFKSLNDRELLPYTYKDRLTSDISDTLDDCCFTRIETDEKNNKIFFDDLANIVNSQISLLNSKKNVENTSLNYRTIAILARTNSEVATIKRELFGRGINVEVDSTGNLFQLPSTIDLYKLLQALVFNKDNSRLVNFIESNYVRTRIDYQVFYSMNKIEIQNYLCNELDLYFAKNMNCTFSDIINDIYTKPVLYVMKKIYDGLAPWKNYSSDEKKQKHYMANYSFLVERIVKYSNVDSLTINQVLEYLRLNIVTGKLYPSREESDKCERVKVIASTIHKSKGLEYGTIILPYTNKNLLSESRNGIEVALINNELAYRIKLKNKITEYNDNYDHEEETGEQLKEETRVLYVALTRAIRNCIWMDSNKHDSDENWANMLGE